MKFLHISDLHIGKRVNEFSMIEDQKYILRQIKEIALEKQVDAVMIVSPVYDGEVRCVTCQDAYGELCIWLLPFIRPAVVRHAWRKVTEGISIGKKDAGTKQDLAQEDDVETVETYQDALQFVVSHMPVDASKRNILVAHQFVTGASRCESEEVSVGGLDQIGAEVFDVFDYVALGHIHSPQHIERETLRYCGTPLKYSFSEAEQKKSVVVMEIKEKGDIFIEKVPLKPLRDLRKIRGTYMELMSKDFYEGTETDDYLQITLTDEEDVPDGMAKLRTIYPNLMQLVYDNSRTRQSRQVEVTEHVEQKSEMELFEEFYEIQNNQPMSEEQQDFVRELMEELVH